jgi:hypothetical protein
MRMQLAVLHHRPELELEGSIREERVVGVERAAEARMETNSEEDLHSTHTEFKYLMYF